MAHESLRIHVFKFLKLCYPPSWFEWPYQNLVRVFILPQLKNYMPPFCLDRLGCVIWTLARPQSLCARAVGLAVLQSILSMCYASRSDEEILNLSTDFDSLHWKGCHGSYTVPVCHRCVMECVLRESSQAYLVRQAAVMLLPPRMLTVECLSKGHGMLRAASSVKTTGRCYVMTHSWC